MFATLAFLRLLGESLYSRPRRRSTHALSGFQTSAELGTLNTDQRWGLIRKNKIRKDDITAERLKFKALLSRSGANARNFDVESNVCAVN